MKSILIFSTLLLFLLPDLKAQTQFETWHKETIYLHSSGYVKEGKKFKRGFFNRKLKKELSDSPVATLEFNKSQKNIGISFGLIALSFASCIVALNQGFDGNEKSSLNFLLGGTALSLVSIPFSLKANNQIHRAVWMHNGDLIVKKEK